MKSKFGLFSIVMIMAIMTIFPSVTFAQGTIGQTQSFSTQGVSTPQSSSDSGRLDQIQIKSDPSLYNVPVVTMPNVQMEQAEKWIERKGRELIDLLQTFVQPFAIILFSLGVIVAGIGAFGNSQLIGKGMIGMVIAVFAYAVVLAAPEILDFTNLWLKS